MTIVNLSITIHAFQGVHLGYCASANPVLFLVAGVVSQPAEDSVLRE